MARFTGARHQAPHLKLVLCTQAQGFMFRKQALYLLSHIPSLHLICFLRIRSIQHETGYSLDVSESFSSFLKFLNSVHYLEHTRALYVSLTVFLAIRCHHVSHFQEVETECRWWTQHLTSSLSFFETRSHPVVQAALISLYCPGWQQSSCLDSTSTGITGMNHYSWPYPCKPVQVLGTLSLPICLRQTRQDS